MRRRGEFPPRLYKRTFSCGSIDDKGGHTVNMQDQRNQRIMAKILSRYAAENVPAPLDLWPAFQERLIKHRARPARYASMNFRPTLGIAVALALSLIVVLPIAVPRAQSTIRDQLQHFGIVLVDSTAIPVFPAVAPAATASSGSPTRGTAAPTIGAPTPLLPVTLAEAQQHVPFPIRLPGWVPDGQVLRGVIVPPSPSDLSGGSPRSTALVLYHAANGSSAVFRIEETSGVPQGGYAFPADRAREAIINGRTAVYVKGAWQSSGAWSDSADVSSLTWQEAGMTYFLQASGLGLSQADMIRIAESLYPWDSNTR